MKVTPARLELTVKFSQLPEAFTEEQGGARAFEVGGDEGGARFLVTLNKKSCKRLAKAAEEWTEWMAVVTGKLGGKIGTNLYRIENAGLTNLVERTPKENAAPAEPGEGGQSTDAAQNSDAKTPAEAPAVALPPETSSLLPSETTIEAIVNSGLHPFIVSVKLAAMPPQPKPKPAPKPVVLPAPKPAPRRRFLTIPIVYYRAGRNRAT